MLEAGLLIVLLLGVVDLVMMAIGLYNPKKVFPKDPAPTRRKVLVGGGAMFAVLLVIFAGLGAMLPSTPDVIEKAAATAAPARKGIGLSRVNVHAIFAGGGYAMQAVDQVNGLDRWFGTGERGIAETLGDANDLAEVAVTYSLIVNTSSVQQKDMTEMIVLLTTAFPDWQESGQWMINAMTTIAGSQTHPGVSITRNGKIALIAPSPIGFTLSIRADWAENRFTL